MAEKKSAPKAKSARIYRNDEGTFVISQDISLGFVCCFSIWFSFFLFFFFVIFVFFFYAFPGQVSDFN